MGRGGSLHLGGGRSIQNDGNWLSASPNEFSGSELLGGGRRTEVADADSQPGGLCLLSLLGLLAGRDFGKLHWSGVVAGILLRREGESVSNAGTGAR